MRFIATADWQLGMTAHYLSDEARPRFHQARIDALVRIGDLARSHNAACVIVCGDVFESNQLDRAIITRTFEALKSITVPVILLPGNHDPLDSASIYDSPLFRARQPEHVHVLRDNSVYTVAPGIEIVGAPWFSKRPLQDLVAAACVDLTPVPEGTVRIIAAHGAVSTLNPDRDELATIDVPALESVLDNGYADVAVIGDRHGTYKVTERIWYPGTPEVTSRREIDPGNILVIDAEKGEVDVEKIHVGQWAFMTVAEQINSLEDVRALEERLDAIPYKDRTGIWLSLSGTLTTASYAALESMLEEKGELFAYLDYWKRHTDLTLMPGDHDFSNLGLSGFADEALSELIALSEDANNEQADKARDALGLLYRFAGGEK